MVMRNNNSIPFGSARSYTRFVRNQLEKEQEATAECFGLTNGKAYMVAASAVTKETIFSLAGCSYREVMIDLGQALVARFEKENIPEIHYVAVVPSVDGIEHGIIVFFANWQACFYVSDELDLFGGSRIIGKWDRKYKPDIAHKTLSREVTQRLAKRARTRTQLAKPSAKLT